MNSDVGKQQHTHKAFRDDEAEYLNAEFFSTPEPPTSIDFKRMNAIAKYFKRLDRGVWQQTFIFQVWAVQVKLSGCSACL